jgi:hypothetical protein
MSRWVDRQELRGPGAPGFEPTQDGLTASANRDEGDAALVDLGEFGIVDELGIEVEPLRIAAGHSVPELDEAQRLAGLVLPVEIGVGIAENAAFLFVGEEGQDAGASLAAHGQIVVVQTAGIASVGNGVKVEGEGVGRREQQW